MKIGSVISIVFTFAGIARSQVTPPETVFKPDTSLPKVNVPEFVITGKAGNNMAQFNKESTRIDSLYFQNKALAGLIMEIPVNRSLSLQSSNFQAGSLFAHVSTGSYATTSYLLSGCGGIGGTRLNGSLGGNYTSGYTPQTMRRDVSVQAGAGGDIELDESAKTTNSAEIGYSRASFFLYGTGITNLLRTTNGFDLVLRSDMNFGNFPLGAGLSFDRFSVQDFEKAAQSVADLKLNSMLQLQSGSINLDGSLRFGNHNTTSPLSPIDQSFYKLTLGAEYGNNIGDFSYAVALNYFQYADDSGNGIAKIYPDLRGTYKVNNEVSLSARFFGDVENSSLSTFLNGNRYVEMNFPLRNSQDYANFTFGGDWIVNDEISVSPKLNISASRFYPIFVTFPSAFIGADTSHADNQLLYANKATIFTASVSVQYKKDKFGADATLNSRIGTADSLTSIPNLAPFDLTVGAIYQINPQFNLRASIFILSARYSDLALKNKISPAWLLNFHLAYNLKVAQLPVEIFADVKNVLDQKYDIWQGYQEFPIGLFIGINSKIL
ncbi:MAG TPA: hypothetical protein VLX91_15755 [Candidatus Acidoferrales bacterium]|nr:hypothetical protein [Candidatus Acidoferrales bacterium]